MIFFDRTHRIYLVKIIEQKQVFLPDKIDAKNRILFIDMHIKVKKASGFTKFLIILGYSEVLKS